MTAHAPLAADPLLTLAMDILADPVSPEWAKAAQRALDGDTADLEYLKAREASIDAYHEYAWRMQCQHRTPLDPEVWAEMNGRVM